MADSEIPDEVVIHRAVGILREDIAKCKGLENEYFSCSEISLEAEKAFVSPLLYKTLVWLTDKALYNNTTDPANTAPNALTQMF